MHRISMALLCGVILCLASASHSYGQAIRVVPIPGWDQWMVSHNRTSGPNVFEYDGLADPGLSGVSRARKD
jgi:hypothetical protein